MPDRLTAIDARHAMFHFLKLANLPHVQGRIFGATAPQETPLPRVRMQSLNGQDTETIEGHADNAVEQMQLSIDAATRPHANDLAAKLINVFKSLSTTTMFFLEGETTPVLQAPQAGSYRTIEFIRANRTGGPLETSEETTDGKPPIAQTILTFDVFWKEII